MKRYTAQEMRVRADYLEVALADAKTAAMLRQAADIMERANNVIIGNFPVVCTLTKESNLKTMKMRNADARLMAAAPEMYDCLREAVANLCHGCKFEGKWDGACTTNENEKCFVKRWRAALEKAGGAE